MGGSMGFSQNCFQGVKKVLKFVFYPSKSKKQPFFANNFKIQDPCPPSDAHVSWLQVMWKNAFFIRKSSFSAFTTCVLLYYLNNKCDDFVN